MDTIKDGQQKEKVTGWLRKNEKLYNFVRFLYSPSQPWGKLTRKEFLARIRGSAKILDLGSGNRKTDPRVVNIDIIHNINLDIQGDITFLPIKDNQFDALLCESVIEHVREPERVVSEAHRVLKPGGKAFFIIPFLLAEHGSPFDYHRFTREGLKVLFKDYKKIEVGIYNGPVASLLMLLKEFLAVIFSFGNEKLYMANIGIFSLVLFPFKFLDFFGIKLKTAYRIAYSFYVVAEG